MSCCGGTSNGRITLTQKDIDDGLRFQIEYTGGPTVRVTGPITGAEYTFSGLSRLHDIDPRDAPAILLQGQFRMKGLSQPRKGQ